MLTAFVEYNVQSFVDNAGVVVFAKDVPCGTKVTGGYDGANHLSHSILRYGR